jgi:erythrin-vacuolar iron transport family protein
VSETLQGIEFEKLTAKDALDLAILIEEEAHERYLLLARHVGGRYAGDASDAFRTMAVAEAKHGTELAQRRREVFGDARRSVTRGMLYQVEAPDMGAVRTFMSAQQAWEVALACETKAREFFERALESVREPQVRALFAALRDEEVQHEAWVRARMEKLPPGPDVEEDAADEPGSDPGG